MDNSPHKVPKVTWEVLLKGFLTRPLLRVRDLPDSIREKKYLAQFLDRLEAEGKLQRIRRGAYLVEGQNQALDPFVIASVVGEPYAISFYSALAIRGLVESVSQRVYVQTPRRFAPFSFQNTEYVPVVTRKLFGTEVFYRSDVAIQVTDIERTILDCLRMPAYAGGLDEFLRSLEGIQETDLLAVVLDHVLANGSFPDILKFRARFEDRRAEIEQLLKVDLLNMLGERPFYLTLVGLSYCPHANAELELEHARKVFAFLRAFYKAEPDRRVTCNEAAAKIGIDPLAFKRAVAVLSRSNLGVFGWVMDNGDLPAEAGATEAILNYRDLEQALAAQLSRFKAPPELSLRRSTVVSVNFDRLLRHLKGLGKQSLYGKVGFLLRLFQERWKPPEDSFKQLSKYIGKKKTYFPPKQPKGSGRWIREWNLIVPLHLYSRYTSAVSSSHRDPNAAI